ncbi:hypothetical protein BDW02DRAFT_191512 [Decorospora gaudefroyi]|uniref:Uncharacterized protein n=1 Tax=Decorospora gaudefroyi TaxID=184978 RepID=A0A6A5K313_9PLEO|nr:hypothetical protein BDW02DRAFT_191512 [Decorospora gaudefroyi]
MKQRFVGTQRQIWHGLSFLVSAERRIYLAKSKFGPKHAPRLKKAARQAVEDRPLITIALNGTTPASRTPNYTFQETR